MFENLKRDAGRYADLGSWYSQPGFWVGAIYRLGSWADRLPSPLLRLPMWILYRLLKLPTRLLNVDVWAGRQGARIGPGLCLIHPNNIMIGNGVEIGENCLIFHEVTIGTGHIPGRPKIGRNVDIYVGARILGGVSVGDESMVGANCVVTRDVPAKSVVVSSPARVIPRTLSPVADGADRRTGAGGQTTAPATQPAEVAEPQEV
jgi:serine O-acetyltransferase